MPGIEHIDIPATNFASGYADRRAACLHIIVGSLKSAISKFKTAGIEVSSHFGVGSDGRIVQFVSVFDTAYGNGLSWDAAHHCWVDPAGHALRPPLPTPSWPGLSPPTNPNWQTISIEREGQPKDIPTEKSNQATARILRYLTSMFPRPFATWTPGQNLIGHCVISPHCKPNDPGPHCDYAHIASLANTPRIYRVLGAEVNTRPDMSGPVAGWLLPGDVVATDAEYEHGTAHLKNGLGFVRKSELEPV